MPQSDKQHTINGVQFDDSLGRANIQVSLRAVEEWTLENTTNAPGAIDHPLHIHLSPYQITEVFDPNEGLVDPETGTLLLQLEVMDKDHRPVLHGNGNPQIKTQDECDKLSDGTHCETIGVPRYVTDKAKLGDPQNPFRLRQCFLENTGRWSAPTG